MNASENTTPLLVHTLDTLCDELVSGRGVTLQQDSRVVKLDSPSARAIFDWYRRNRGKWIGTNKMDDVEVIAGEVDKTPPELPSLERLGTSRAPEVVYLKKLRAHRFAGIHRYGTIDHPPPDFELNFGDAARSGVWIIEGKNAAGKTSLLSAICWCLTGHVYRSQRAPEKTDEAIQVYFGDVRDDSDGNIASQDISAITPIPPRAILEELGKDKLPIDTWVELTFVNSEGKDLGTVRRSINRIGRGRIEVETPDFSGLGLPPIAMEIGTRMTGLLPYIQVGHKSDLSSAVAELTGLRPLKDLVKHARKTQEKLQKTLPKERAKDIAERDRAYMLECDELAQIIDQHKHIAPANLSLPNPGVATCKEQLDSLQAHFEELQAMALAGAESVLGDGFDKSDKASRDDLIKNVGPALATTDPRMMANLPSASRLHALRSLTEEDLAKANALIETLLQQAHEIAKLEEKKEFAARIRLYAKIGDWLKEQPPQVSGAMVCPVCNTILDGKHDEVTHRPIADHICESLRDDKSHLQHAILQWAQQAANRLFGELSQSLSHESKRDLPDHPIELISKALSEELFEASPFKKTLAPLRVTVARLCEKHLQRMPFEEPLSITFPASISSACSELGIAITRAKRAIAFANWRRANADACRQSLLKIIGKETEASDTSCSSDEDLRNSPLIVQLKALERLVADSEPLMTALARVKKMSDLYVARRDIEERIKRYDRAADAVSQLFQLEQLVEDQVGSLMQALSEHTRRWRKELYMSAYMDAPQIATADVDSDGSLLVHAVVGGTTAPAQHVCNASGLRATLLAFLLAFWKHLAKTQGALSVFLLDELQELFDPHNRARVARTIPRVANDGAQVLLTTNDHEFGKMVCNSANRIADQTIHSHVLPAKAGRPLTLCEFREAIEKRRRAFETRKDDHEAARDYLNELRIYLEAQLLNVFDVSDPAMPLRPTLADLVNAIRRRFNQGMEPFAGQIFQKMVNEPAWQDGSEFFKLMNESHHSRAELISYGEVAGIANECRGALDLAHAVAEEYERWLRRDPAEPVAAEPALMKPAYLPSGRNLSFSVPLMLATAAAGRDLPMYDIIEAEEPFNCDWLEYHAIYVNNTNNLGFTGSKNCRLVVALNGGLPDNHSIVVAIYDNKTYVRRLLHICDDADVVGLAAETSNPLRRPPMLLVPKRNVALMQVVGIVFSNDPIYPRPKEEATLDGAQTTLDQVELALTVRGDSALPLALPGQTILAGAKIHANELASNEGEPVVIATNEGTAFKRVGRVMSGTRHVRQFESIGGLGESIIVRVEDRDKDPFGKLPVLEDARKIIGVLYNPCK